MMGISRNISFPNFIVAMEAFGGEWSKQQADPKGATMILTQFEEIVDSFKNDEHQWEFFNLSLDGMISSFEDLDTLQNETFLPFKPVFSIINTSEIQTDHIFIQELDFPEKFSTTEKILDYTQEERKMKDAIKIEKEQDKENKENFRDSVRKMLGLQPPKKGDKKSEKESPEDLFNAVFGGEPSKVEQFFEIIRALKKKMENKDQENEEQGS